MFWLHDNRCIFSTCIFHSWKVSIVFVAPQNQKFGDGKKCFSFVVSTLQAAQSLFLWSWFSYLGNSCRMEFIYSVWKSVCDTYKRLILLVSVENQGMFLLLLGWYQVSPTTWGQLLALFKWLTKNPLQFPKEKGERRMVQIYYQAFMMLGQGGKPQETTAVWSKWGPESNWSLPQKIEACIWSMCEPGGRLPMAHQSRRYGEEQTWGQISLSKSHPSSQDSEFVNLVSPVPWSPSKTSVLTGEDQAEVHVLSYPDFVSCYCTAQGSDPLMGWCTVSPPSFTFVHASSSPPSMPVFPS